MFVVCAGFLGRRDCSVTFCCSAVRCFVCGSIVSERGGVSRARECWFRVMVDGTMKMGEFGLMMKSSGLLVDRGLKKGGFIVGMKMVEHCLCLTSTYEAFVRPFLFN